jgi:N-acetylneuraminic acid mutarotase
MYSLVRLNSAIVILLCHFGVSAQPWFELPNFMGDARHRATSFSVGNKGYMGLGHINSVVDILYDDIWEFDPASNAWSQKASFPLGPAYHSTAFVIGEKAYVGTGRITGGAYSKKFYEFDPQQNLWTPIADFPGTARRGAVAFTINGNGYVGTGQTNAGYSSDFYCYNPSSNTWTPIVPFPGPARTSSVAFAIGSTGYVGTGSTNSGSTNDFYAFDPTNNQWQVKANVGPTARQEAMGFALNGKGYIGTGDDFSSGNNYGDVWEFDPTNNTWVQIQDFAGTARRYLTAFTIGSRAYAGTGTNGTNFKDFWMFDQVLTTLTSDMKQVNFTCYPNPVSDVLTIDFNQVPEYIDLKELTYALMDFSGKIVKTGAFSDGLIQFDCSALQKGNYNVQISHLNKSSILQKIVVL